MLKSARYLSFESESPRIESADSAAGAEGKKGGGWRRVKGAHRRIAKGADYGCICLICVSYTVSWKHGIFWVTPDAAQSLCGPLWFDRPTVPSVP